MHYNLHKISLNRGGSYIDSPKWLKNKKATINSKNIDDKCFKGAEHSICNLAYKTSKEIPIVFHNGSAYDYHFIIKELAKEFESQFEYLGANTEKYITFQ